MDYSTTLMEVISYHNDHYFHFPQHSVHQLIEVTIIYIVASILEFSGAQESYFMKCLSTKHNAMKDTVFYFINFNKPLTLTCYGINFQAM